MSYVIEGSWWPRNTIFTTFSFYLFISLKDDSFLVYWGNLIVRLDKDFKTKFEPRHDIELTSGKKIKGNFFVLPYEVIKELNQKVIKNNDHGAQG